MKGREFGPGGALSSIQCFGYTQIRLFLPVLCPGKAVVVLSLLFKHVPHFSDTFYSLQTTSAAPFMDFSFLWSIIPKLLSLPGKHGSKDPLSI